MFFLITGAAASGKSTMAYLLKEKLPNAECHDYDEKTVATAIDRCRILEEEWIPAALLAQRTGRDFVLASHSPFGELLAAPSAIRLEGISGCLLDCHDFERVRRHRARPEMADWPLTQHTLSWASWQRMHAHDPQWEQHVIVNPAQPGFEWTRWTSWPMGDKRWQVKVIDSSALAEDQTLGLLDDWINREKAKEAILEPSSQWWF
ncbi:MAG TPA: hypothetical protein VMF29_05065 [Candidatus Edwardsbacteria bacterium]|nr:hypothetical protein [Candidatus Edwardsbacteria bacterium]